jgi:hypothetical protein
VVATIIYLVALVGTLLVAIMVREKKENIGMKNGYIVTLKYFHYS